MTEVTRAELDAANQQHLKWLESYTDTRPELHVAGVNELKAFTYDLLQVLNHEWLQARLHGAEVVT